MSTESLRVFNEEPLYLVAQRATSAESMLHTLECLYTFTVAQWAEFVEDWEADQEEE